MMALVNCASPEGLQVLYYPSAAYSVFAKARMLTFKISATSASKDGQNRFLCMLFAGRAAATKANILLDTSA